MHWNNKTLFHFCLLLYVRVITIFTRRLFHIVVAPPKTSEELQKVAKIYDILGIAGAVGSTDCTHIPLGKCPVSWKNSCIGKEGFPTLAYSMTCDHTRKIMHCTGGFPGSYNDKTIARYDSFIEDVGKNPMFTNFSYNIQTQEGLVEKKGHRQLHVVYSSEYLKFDNAF
jgi:hypothetical protein